MLTGKNGKKLRMSIECNRNYELYITEAAPFKTSPQHDGQNKNEGVKKLVIKMNEKKASIKVSLEKFINK